MRLPRAVRRSLWPLRVAMGQWLCTHGMHAMQISVGFIAPRDHIVTRTVSYCMRPHCQHVEEVKL